MRINESSFIPNKVVSGVTMKSIRTEIPKPTKLIFMGFDLFVFEYCGKLYAPSNKKEFEWS